MDTGDTVVYYSCVINLQTCALKEKMFANTFDGLEYPGTIPPWGKSFGLVNPPKRKTSRKKKKTPKSSWFAMCSAAELKKLCKVCHLQAHCMAIDSHTATLITHTSLKTKSL